MRVKEGKYPLYLLIVLFFKKIGTTNTVKFREIWIHTIKRSPLWIHTITISLTCGSI
jgi:hypothetical protein